LPIVGEHAARVTRLPPMRLLTNDAVLAAYGDIVTIV
jgi:hypothetical protein